jgi:hypothetical protein
MPKSLFFPTLIKNRLRRAPSMRQYLVQLAEVIPTSSGRSPYPPSALTRGRLACSIHLHSVISSFRFIPQPHTPLRHFATLMAPFRLSIAGSRQFSLFLISFSCKANSIDTKFHGINTNFLIFLK